MTTGLTIVTLGLLLFAGGVSGGIVDASGNLTGPDVAAQQRVAICKGTVVDQDGNPIEGVGVSVEEWYLGSRLDLAATAAGGRYGFTEVTKRRSQFDIETKGDGTFTHPGLNPNIEYRVRFEKEGFIPVERKMVFHVATNAIGTITLVSGNVEAAQEAYDKGYEAYQKQRFQEAARAMEEVVDVYGESDSSDQMLVVGLAVLGMSHLQMQQLAEAESAFERLEGITPDSVTLHNGLGRVRANQGRTPEAVVHFAKAVEVGPENANAHFYLGSLLQMTGRPADAVPLLERCLELQADFVQAHGYLGKAYAETGDAEKAVTQLEQYLEGMPNAPDAAQVRALIQKLKAC